MGADELGHTGDGLPRVSVVIPTHNRKRLLASTLHCVLGQRDVHFEVLVVDDGSSDGTALMVEVMADERLRVLRNDPARGVSGARNRGIAEATGQWIAFCDDDDLWSPDKLAAQLWAAEAASRSWVYTGAVNISSGGRVVGGSPPPTPEQVIAELPYSNVVPGGCSGVMATGSALRAAGQFDPQLGPGADWDLWLRLLRVGPPACAEAPHVAYRLHAGNMSLASGRMEADFAILADRYPTVDHAVFHRYLGWWSLRVGKQGAALRYFTRAARDRSARYTPPEYLADLRYLGRDATDRVGRRYGFKLWPHPRRRQPADEYLNAARNWLDPAV